MSRIRDKCTEFENLNNFFRFFNEMASDEGCSRFYSRRWEFVFLVFSGAAIVYTLRVNMSVAAQEMRDELNWSENDKGLVLVENLSLI